MTAWKFAIERRNVMLEKAFTILTHVHSVFGASHLARGLKFTWVLVCWVRSSEFVVNLCLFCHFVAEMSLSASNQILSTRIMMNNFAENYSFWLSERIKTGKGLKFVANFKKNVSWRKTIYKSPKLSRFHCKFWIWRWRFGWWNQEGLAPL